MTTAATYCMEKTFALSGRTSSAVEDLELLDRCRAGDADAFREIYGQHKVTVYRVVSRMISIPADQEEVMQDVFLQVFRSLRSFRGSARLSTWIHRIAVNVILQHIRRKKSRIQLHFDTHENLEKSPVAAPFSLESSPENHLESMERRQAVERSLSGLSAKKRVALVLHDFEGLQAKEISEIVGAPILTVRTRVFYARREFYSRLADEPAFADVVLEAEAIK